MSLDPTDLLTLLALVSAASYLQAVVGFGFGLIIMGLTVSLGLMSVGDTAIIVSMLAVVNTATAFKWDFNNVLRRQAVVSLALSLPMLGVGLYLVAILSESYMQSLRMLLGITIIASSWVVIKPPSRETSPSTMASFAFSGMLSGLTGGMFSCGGPPVVFQFYRQPLAVNVIKETLLAMFIVGSFVRTLMIALTVGISGDLLVFGALAFPLVVLFSAVGRRYPPGFSESVMRRIVFVLLILSAAPLFLE